MELSVERVDVWAATIEDKPGGLAQVLNALRQAGVDLQFVVARRTPEAAGKGVVFVAPLQGESEIRAATQAGFSVSPSLHSVRVMGMDQLGIISGLFSKFKYAYQLKASRCRQSEPIRKAGLRILERYSHYRRAGEQHRTRQPRSPPR